MKLLLFIVLLCVGFSDSSEKPKWLLDRDQYNCHYKANQGFVDDYTDLFHAIDKDQDGYVTHEELLKFFDNAVDNKGKKIPMSKDEAEKRINDADVDGDGRLSLDEWIRLFVDREVNKYGIQHTFDMYDKDKNNKVTLDELTSIFTAGGKKHPAALARIVMEVLDCDKSGDLDYEEFKGIFRFKIGTV